MVSDSSIIDEFSSITAHEYPFILDIFDDTSEEYAPSINKGESNGSSALRKDHLIYQKHETLVTKV